MAYGLKYTSSWWSEAWSGSTSTNYVLKIYKEGFVGSSTTVCMGGNPCVEKPINTDDTPYGIKSCRYEFEVVSDTLSVDDFYTEDGKDFLFELYEAGTPDVLIRKGYLISEDVSEEYSDGIKTITITGTDGLELLKTINYELVEDKAYQGIASVFSILFNCLDKVGLGLKFNTAFNYYPNGVTAGDGIDSLAFHNLHQELFQGLTCYEVLDRLTQTHQCVLEQEDGEWWYIHKINPTGATVTYRKWTPFGALIDDYTLPEPIDVVFNGEYAPVELPQVLKNRPYKRVISEVDLKGYENKLRNADFQDGFLQWNSAVVDSYNFYPVDSYSFGGQGLKNNPYYIQINGWSNRVDFGLTPKVVYQNVVTLYDSSFPVNDVYKVLERGVRVSGKVIGNGVKSTDFGVRMVLTFDNYDFPVIFELSETGEWESRDTGTPAWTTVPLVYENGLSKEEYTSFSIESKSIGKAAFPKTFYNRIFNNKLIKLDIAEMTSCKIEFVISEGIDQTTIAASPEWVRWAELEMEIVDKTRSVGLKKNRYVSQKSGVAPSELKVERYFADFYEKEQFISIIGSDGETPTNLWTTTNNNNTGDLLTALTRELFSLYYKPISLYDGNILGKVKKYHTINLVDYTEPLINVNWGYDFGRNIVESSRYIMTFPAYVGDDNKKYGVYNDDKEILYDGEFPTGKLDFDESPILNGDLIAKNLTRIKDNVVFDDYMTFSKSSNESGVNWYDSVTGDKTDYFITSDEGFKFKSASSVYEVNLDFSELTSNTVLKVPILAGVSTIATDTTAWMIGGNSLTTEGLIGSTSNQTVRLISNSENKISLIASGGVIVHHDTTFEGDILGEGNITIEKGNPRLRLRDVGGSVHTSGFDVHVNGDSFLIDDNTHSRNVLKNYLSSTTHITEFDADEYYFKDGATTYASLIGGNLNLPSLTASQLVATDASKNIVSLSTATYPSLTELSYVKGVTSTIQTQIDGKFATPTGLTTNYVTKWNGTGLANSQIFDNGTNVGIGTASPTFKLDVAGNIRSSDYIRGLYFQPITGGVLNGVFSAVSTWTGGATNNDLAIASYQPNIRFYTNGSTTVRQIIDSSGNVGIGTASPTQKLDIVGNVRISSTNPMRYEFNKSGSFFSWIESDGVVGNNFMRFAVANTEYMRILQSGNVGIGTTSPATLLDVRGQVSANLGSLTNPTYSFVGDLNTGIYSPSADAMALVTGGVNRVHVTSGGNVGIATENALSKFQVDAAGAVPNANFSTSHLTLNSTSAAAVGMGSSIRFAGQSGNGVANYTFGVIQGSKDSSTANDYKGNLIFYTVQPNGALVERIRINGDGNIGVANSSPSYRLDINGTGHFTGAVTFDTVPSSLQDATSANHLVRYSQWIASTSIKYLPTAVNTVALTNVSSLSGAQNINGVTGVAGTTRILLTAQTDATKNSIWVMQSGAWTRAADSDTDTEIRGFIVSVSGGTYAGYKYINTNSSAITIDTTNITYSEFSNISEIDPVFVSWRDTTRTANTFWAAPNGSNGAATWRALVAADVPTLNQNTTGSAATLTTTRNIAATGDIAWNVDFNGSAAVTAAATLATVNSNIGTFNNVTVNAKGLVTAASNVSYLTANQTITLSGDVTGSGTTAITATLANSGVTAGTYTKITVDAKGRATNGTTLSASDIPSLDWSKITSGKPTTLSGYGITDAWTKTESDGRYVDFTTDNQDITGIKLFSGGLRVSNVLGSTATISRGAYLKDGGATQALYFDATNVGVDYSSFFAVSNAGNIKYLFSDDGLLIGDTLDYEVYASEKLHINGNVRLSGSIKPDNVAPTAGYFLKGVDADNMTWAALSTSDISNLSSYTGFNDTYQAKDATLTALAALDTNGGILTQIGTDTFAKRTISGTTNRVSITNGNGVSGNPTIDIASSYVGQASITTLGTITTGTWNAGVIPLLYGGTGSSTKNFVDLTTEQNNIAGIKTFTSHILVRGLRIGESDGFAGTGIGGDVYVDTNALGSLSRPIDFSTDKVYFSDASSLPYAVITESGLKLGGLEHYGSIPSERLDVDGNITFTGVLMPEGEAGTSGQFLRTTTTSNVWSTILTSDVYNLETILEGKQEQLIGTGIVRSTGGGISYIDGTSGQIMAKDSAGNFNFMDLKIKPIGLSNERIGVGNIDNYLGEQPQFLFKDKRYISIGRITDNAKQLNIGMVKASNDAFIGHLGGKLSISATNGLYFNEFESPNAGLRMLTIDASGRISASTITSGGGVISDIQSVLTAGDVATDRTIIFRSTSTAAISLRDGSNVINGTLTNGSQVALSSSTKALEINGDTELNLYSNGNINIGTSSTSQVISLNGMPFNFNEDSLAQGANKWGSSSNSSSPQSGDMILSIFFMGKMIPLKVKAEILNLGSGNKNYLYVDET